MENSKLNQFADLFTNLIAKYIDELDIENMQANPCEEKDEQAKEVRIFCPCEPKKDDNSDSLSSLN